MVVSHLLQFLLNKESYDPLSQESTKKIIALVTIIVGCIALIAVIGVTVYFVVKARIGNRKFLAEVNEEINNEHFFDTEVEFNIL